MSLLNAEKGSISKLLSTLDKSKMYAVIDSFFQIHPELEDEFRKHVIKNEDGSTTSSKPKSKAVTSLRDDTRKQNRRRSVSMAMGMKAFYNADKDRNGVIDLDELHWVLGQFDPKVTFDQAATVYRQIAGGSITGSISADKFLEAIATYGWDVGVLADKEDEGPGISDYGTWIQKILQEGADDDSEDELLGGMDKSNEKMPKQAQHPAAASSGGPTKGRKTKSLSSTPTKKPAVGRSSSDQKLDSGTKGSAPVKGAHRASSSKSGLTHTKQKKPAN